MQRKGVFHKMNTGLIKTIIRKATTLLRQPKLIILKILHTKAARLIPDKTFVKLSYWSHFGKWLNLNNPITFNQKLQWLKLNHKEPNYCTYADKYAVRNYIKEIIGERYLVPIIGVYDSVDDIEWDILPEKYVLKCTNASGRNIICLDKLALDIDCTKNKLQKWMKDNFFWHGREWVYKTIKPRIIAEQYLEDTTYNELIDYKFMCFNGEPKCLFLCLDRHSNENLKVDFYDMDWKSMPFERHYNKSSRQIPKPICYDEMVLLARKLSKGIPFVRVDFYEVNGQVYFGELTFFPGNGMEEFRPEYYDELLGGWIALPDKTN